MNPELQIVLQDCLRSANELLRLLEQDDMDMQACIGGEILEAYQKGLQGALQRAEEIKQALSVLQQENI